jgi:hypothetical protein
MKRRNTADGDKEELPQEEQSPKEISKEVNGKIRKYHFLKTVTSVEELDKIGFKVIKNR